MSPLAAWANFYVIAGTAATTLTGLMFVVVTLIASGQPTRPPAGAGNYSTPTVVHFGATLVVAVLLSAPWPALWLASLPLGLVGLGGLIYSGIVLRRLGHRGPYRPVLEDWVCHAILPLGTYAALLAAALLLPQRPVPALFAVGTVVVLLLLLGIHNAWDVVTYLTFERAGAEEERRD